jgi:transglutaminase-like putative cysteine protease
MAGDKKYPVSEIPEELTKDINAVVREDKMEYRIISQSKASVYAYYAVTIFNTGGKEYANRQVDYDKLTKVISFSGSVYDATGNLIRRLKNSEITDHSIYDGGLYNDNRIKSADLTQSNYPYTVVFEYEKEYRFLYMIDGSVIVPDEKISVQHASYQLIYPLDLAPRYTVFNIDKKPTQGRTSDGFESLTWEFKNVMPIKFEPLSSRREVVPQIMAAPTKFEFDGYEGTMQTWDEFGRWINSLNKGRNILPEETKRNIKQLTAGLSTNEEKTKAIYEYMQNKTRYVSIQLGIGGFQPFEASVVDQTGYGDCKALSNYTIALLEVAGVKANYALIMAGRNASSLITEFPSSQFNHAFAFVPNGTDTLWLECTSQTNPFGYSGWHTGDRNALAITEEGAKIVRTPSYSADQNKQTTTANVFVQTNGNANAKVRTTYSGLQYENGSLSFVLGNQYDDQKKWIQKNTDIPSFDINSFSMANVKTRIPSAIVTTDLTLNRLASVSGKRLFLTPNLMNRSTFIPEKVESRKTKVIRKMAYVDIDTINYNLPEEIYPEFLPEPIKIKSRFGEYEASFKLSQGKLVYIRKISMWKGEFPPESYSELIDFYRNLNKADNTKVVFLSKT